MTGWGWFLWLGAIGISALNMVAIRHLSKSITLLRAMIDALAQTVWPKHE